MADNITVTQGTGTTMATDDVSGVQYPRVKVSIGADGSAVDVSTANPMPVSVTNLAGVTSNNWVTLRSFSIDTVSADFNTRPTTGQFVTIADILPGTQQIEVVAKIKTTPSSLYRLFIWIDDGTEVYCVSPSINTAGDNSFSVQDTNDIYDGAVPVLIDLKRYTPSIKVAARIVVEAASVVVDVDGNCFNPSFKGGEEVLLNTTGVLPSGLAANAENFDGATDSFSYTGANFTANEPLRITHNNGVAGLMPPLGIAACIEAKDLVLGSNELVLDGRVPNPFVVGDTVRLRAYGNSVLPTTSVGAFTQSATFTVSFSSGNTIKLSIDAIQNYLLVTQGVGKFFIFKWPYDYVFMRGTNQLSRTAGGPAIDFIDEYTNVPVTITPGQAAHISYPTGTFTPRNIENSWVFTVAALGTAISAGAVYRVTSGGVNYDFTIGNGASIGDTIVRTTAFTGSPPATGTLALQSGTGPASIAYTANTFGLIANNTFLHVIWADTLNLFVACASTGTGNRIMTSPDGITWTARQSAADNTWVRLAWNGTILVAIAQSGTGNRVMTSTNGINWTLRTSAADLSWSGITWSSTLNLFVAVAITGVGSRVMTSPDGITWTLRAVPSDLTWTDVIWAGGSTNLFVAVAASGFDNRVMTSPDGITWTLRSVPISANYRSIAWSPTLNLFVAVGDGGVIITSPDAITWTQRTTPLGFNYTFVMWHAGLNLFVASASNGTNNRINTSPDGINWSVRTTPIDQTWVAVAESPNLNRMVVISSSSIANAIMTSDNSSWIAHGYSAGKELILQATTPPTGAVNSQRFFVAASPAPTAYAYSLSLTNGGPAVAFSAVGTGVNLVDPLTPEVLNPVNVMIGVPANLTFAQNFVIQNSLTPMKLSGAVLPGGYTSGQTLYPTSSLLSGVQVLSLNKFTPTTFTSAGTSVTMSSPGYIANIVLEKTRAFVAQSPVPSNTNLKLANTAGGAAITTKGGIGSFEIKDVSGTQIKATSYVKARAI